MSTSSTEDPTLLEESQDFDVDSEEFLENLKRLPAVLKKKRSHKILTLKDREGEEFHIKLPPAAKLSFEVEFEKEGNKNELEFSIKWSDQSEKPTIAKQTYGKPKPSIPVGDIEGIGPAHGAKLREKGIRYTHTLLSKFQSKGATKLAEETGLSETVLTKFSAIADLMRVKGISSQSSELIQMAGVNSAEELATSDTDELLAAIKKVMEEKPTLNKILIGPGWVKRKIVSARMLMDWESQTVTEPAADEGDN